MSRRIMRRNLVRTPDKKMDNGMKRLEQTIRIEQGAYGHHECTCHLCQTHESKVERVRNPFFESSKNAHKWLYEVLSGLSRLGGQSLKLFLPDICFVDGDQVEIFRTQPKDGRIMKVSGTTPLRMLYSTMIRLRRQYKSILEENFHKKMIDEVNRDYMHEKYMDKLLPSYFHHGDNSITLSKNISKFKSYTLHKNPNYIINSLEEHKINDNEPFCIVRFTDANSQLFSKVEFENFMIGKIPNDIAFVKAYIKEKKQSQSIVSSCYIEGMEQGGEGAVDQDLFRRAELEIMVLVDAIGKYNSDYQDLEVFEDLTLEIMKNDVSTYCKLMTYKIVHYLSMIARIFVTHIKINWVVNDIGLVYLQKIIQYERSDSSKRPLRYQIPPKEESMAFYKDAGKFLTLYKQMKMVREYKKNQVREKLEKQTKQASPPKPFLQNQTIRTRRMSQFGRKSIDQNKTIDTTLSLTARSHKAKLKNNSILYLKQSPRYQQASPSKPSFHSFHLKKNSTLDKYHI